MKIGIIDVDAESRGKITFPNLALMKISAWHKRQGNDVEWYAGLFNHYDIVYCSKVFGDEYTKPLPYVISNADKVVYGGSGYAISVKDGRETYDKAKDASLPQEIEHIMPDYSMYPAFPNEAYGFLTRGCPRGCHFCHVAGMQGRTSHKVAELSEFWNGQKYIKLLDPNILACKEWKPLLQQLADSKAYIDYTQGVDFRLLTDEKAAALAAVKTRAMHFAWDNPTDDLTQQIELFRRYNAGMNRSKLTCYVLTNYDSTFEQDVWRVETLKSLNVQPYVMVYRKSTAPANIRKLQRYANNPTITWAVKTFNEYQKGVRECD